MRYIIGLIPLEQQSYIQTAQKLFADVSDGYLLSPAVHPHITVAQFELDNDNAKLEKMWGEIAALKIKPFEPLLIGLSFIKGQKAHQDFYWAQIAVERDHTIMAAHHQVLEILRQNRLDWLNDAQELYKPHITLARIKLEKSIPLWPTNILEDLIFKIALGSSDLNGRYLKTLYE